jgi:hypothetical protein
MINSSKPIQDIAEIRRMMERSSKFLSLSGWAGILAGIYAITGAWFTHSILDFVPDNYLYFHSNILPVAGTAAVVLTVALITAFLDSVKKAQKRNEKIWNTISKRMLEAMAVPFITGSVIIVILSINSLHGFAAPFMLIFYGLALYIAGYYTYKEIRVMGFLQIILGILNLAFIQTGLLFWAMGFGVLHIVYGIFMYIRYER